jgi:hypothetical protein
MIRFFLYAIVLIHGLIHLIGFAEAFNLLETPQFTRHISRIAGVCWLMATFLFIASFVLMLAQYKDWWIILLFATLSSQFLILTYWHDAKYGTLPNIILLLVIVAGYGIWQFEKQYQKDVALAIQNTSSKNDLLAEGDLAHLPEVVKRYIIASGALHQPKINSFSIAFEGRMRDRGKDWFSFTSVQVNTIQPSARFFFMKAQMFGITVPGYHRYVKSNASMRIKLFGLVPIVDIAGKELSQAETVTLFNDMCLMAPASLIDKRIQREPIDSLHVKAMFTNEHYTISAELVFNPANELINFISNDRYAMADMKKYQFSTPISQYKKMNGWNIGTYGEAIWWYPEGKFVYGKFELKEVAYNLANR